MNNNLNPTWNETFVLDVCSTEIHCLWVRVLDDDGGYGADNLLGTAVVPLAAMKGLADARGALKNPSEDVFGGGVHAKRGVIEIVTRYEPFDETETLETKTLETKTLEATTTEETTEDRHRASRGGGAARAASHPDGGAASSRGSARRQGGEESVPRENMRVARRGGRVERERGDAGDWSRSSTPPLERSHSLDAGVADAPTPESKSSRSLSARMLSLVSGGGGGGGGGGSPARGKGPAEIEIEISWSTYEHVKSYSANESSSSARGGGASSASRRRARAPTARCADRSTWKSRTRKICASRGRR